MRIDLPPGVTCAIEDKSEEADADVLASGLEQFNEAAWPRHEPWQTLGVFLRREGKVVGGLFGETYAGWLFIRYLWLEDALRRGGIGRGLMEAAEARAKERGCHSALVDTFSFQAPGFYLKLDYAEFGRLPYPPDFERIFLKKALG